MAELSIPDLLYDEGMNNKRHFKPRKWRVRVLAQHEVPDYAPALRKLAHAEQARQDGRLLDGVAVDEYIEKLEGKAELAVLEVDGKCCGFCAFYTYDPTLDEAFIALFLVAPEVQRNGMARGILESVAASALQKGFRYLALRVREDNYQAIQFYLSQGFLMAGQHGKDYAMRLEMTALSVG